MHLNAILLISRRFTAGKYFGEMNGCLKVGKKYPGTEIEGNNNVSHISANILTNTAKKILDMSFAD